jgi:uncharacterized membrane protein
MEELKQTLLNIHIVCGSIALLTGPLAMINQTGNSIHRVSGKLFFYAMTVVFVTSVYLSIIDGLLFLLLVGVFSYYQIVTGYRSLYLKKLGKGQKPKSLDWAITGLTTVFHLGMIVWGFDVVFLKHSSFGIIALIFGLLGGLFNARDINHYIKGYKEKSGWLFIHISGMIGGYIAAVTAFLVNVVTFQPSFVLWLLPSLILVPVMLSIMKKFRRNFKKGKEVNDLAKINI